MAKNIIEVGKRLIQAKSLVQHGQWQNWLNDNFQLSQQTARKFMQVAERFTETRIDTSFNSTQMIALLSLPDAAETEKFLAEKAAEDKNVADNPDAVQKAIDDAETNDESQATRFRNSARREILKCEIDCNLLQMTETTLPR